MRVVLEDTFEIAGRGVFGLVRCDVMGWNYGDPLVLGGLRVTVEDVAPRLLDCRGQIRTNAVVLRFEERTMEEVKELKGLTHDLCGI